MRARAARIGLLMTALACALGPGAARADLARWLPRQERISWRLLQRNISPIEPKVPGGARPRRGAVLGALHKQDPDYWFHWVRDSAHVMSTVLDMHAQGRA
jgi:hypothetical protein